MNRDVLRRRYSTERTASCRCMQKQKCACRLRPRPREYDWHTHAIYWYHGSISAFIACACPKRKAPRVNDPDPPRMAGANLHAPYHPTPITNNQFLSSPLPFPPPHTQARLISMTNSDAFLHAAQEFETILRTGAVVVPDDVKLELYGLYKQAVVGDCNTPHPGTFSLDFKAKAKWQAWNSRRGMTTDVAESKYIMLVELLD